jgi:4-amino-4-deoxy-L-arabinose transferase-like glycosyltransferase
MPFLGGVHLFDWDEINFAECAREMIVLKDYLRVHVNFQPFWEKPPFFFWLQSTAMHLFGIGEYAARFPNALCGVITLALLFRMGTKLHDWRFGALWAGAYMGSILPHLYFKSGIIDPWFNLFIFLGLYLFIQFYWKKDGYTSVWLNYNKYVYLIGGGLMLGMGVLTKGWVAYLIVCLTLFVYWVLQRFRFYVNVFHFLLFTVATAIITLTWYGVETLLHGPWFIQEFTRYNYRLFSTPDAGHGGFPGYHFVVLLIGCFPASIFCIRGFGRIPQQFMYQRDFKVWMTILFWVVLILFTIVKSKIVHYSSMCYFPLTYLAALTAYEIIEGRIKFAPWMRGMLIGIGGLFCFATIVLPFVAMKIQVLKPLFSKDPFAAANLDAVVNWTGFESFAGLWLFAVIGLSLRYIHFNRAERGFATLFLGTAFFVTLTLVFFIGRIELYSQGAAIRFFESLQPKVRNHECYVVNYGYRSYAQLFYTRKLSLPKQENHDEQWLLHGEVDRDVYVITKINKTQELEGVPGLQKLGEENGFVFYKRSAVAGPRQP